MVVCADIVGQVELAGKGARVHRWNQRQNRYSVRGDWALSDRFLCSYLRKQHFVFEPTLTRIEGCETAAAALRSYLPRVRPSVDGSVIWRAFILRNRVLL